MSTKRHNITAALPYANGPLHIGHIAGAYLPADIYAKHLKAIGKKVLFICGSDEHGAAITLRAKKENTTPKAIVDKYHNLISKSFSEFGINFDVYHRTSSELHHKTAQDFFRELNNKGCFDKQTSKQYYDEEFKQFLADRYISGTCPKCNNEGAYGDQCEKCGSALSPEELIEPKSTLSGKKPILKETYHWYLPMAKHEKWLSEWIDNGTLDGKTLHNPKTWRNQVTGQCKSWIDGGLHSRAMTRDLDWGVKVPIEGADGKVLYVWLDAPIGYISATKKWANEHNENWKDWWQNEDTELVHFIGKDNIVFHCIIFPILLKEHGDFILPKNVPANEFLNLEGDKISTSRNHAVWLHEYLEDFPNQQDSLRYVLNSIAPESKDSEFTWKDFQARHNNELVAILGNFVNRAVVLTHKYFDGKIPEALLSQREEDLIAEIAKIPLEVDALIKQFKFREAQAKAMELARLGNKYLAETEPWKLIKHNEMETKTILNISLQIAANLSIVLNSFLPNTASNLCELLNVSPFSWSDAGSAELLKEGHEISKASLLFAKIEDEAIEFQLEKLAKNKTLNAREIAKSKAKMETKETEVKSTIDFNDFTKLDLKVGTVLTAVQVPKTDKLMHLTVDTGDKVRNIISGIALHYTTEELIGKKVTVLCNLEPRKMRGIMSEGMMLMAENTDGELSLLSPEKAVESGASIN